MRESCYATVVRLDTQDRGVTALCVMIAAAIYTAQKDTFHVDSIKTGSYGSSYILAWVGFPMTLVSGLMYLVLRKRK